MDQRRPDQPSTTGVTERREASVEAPEPQSSWVPPAQQSTATPAADEIAGPPAPAMYAGTLTDVRPGTPHAPGNGVPVAEHQPRLEAPEESHDHESPEPDRPSPEAQADWRIELMAIGAREQYRARWSVIQTGFVDDPAQAVWEADHLVADVMQHLQTTFAEERGRLEERWSKGDEDTEHLRMALQRYRQFFGLLLME
jgi:hypothetical protein